MMGFVFIPMLVDTIRVLEDLALLTSPQKQHIRHCSSWYGRSYCYVLVYMFCPLVMALLTGLVICNFFGFLLIVLSLAEMSSMCVYSAVNIQPKDIDFLAALQQQEDSTTGSANLLRHIFKSS
jgi:hypothetical protein